jgi:hypothetical protein
MMTKVKLARKIAYRSKPKFLEIERLCRSTAERNEKKRRIAESDARISALLEAEQARLIKTW